MHARIIRKGLWSSEQAGSVRADYCIFWIHPKKDATITLHKRGWKERKNPKNGKVKFLIIYWLKPRAAAVAWRELSLIITAKIYSIARELSSRPPLPEKIVHELRDVLTVFKSLVSVRLSLIIECGQILLALPYLAFCINRMWMVNDVGAIAMIPSSLPLVYSKNPAAFLSLSLLIPCPCQWSRQLLARPAPAWHSFPIQIWDFVDEPKRKIDRKSVV